METINILGTDYTIYKRTEAEDPNLNGIVGYCDATNKTIVVHTMDGMQAESGLPIGDGQYAQNETLRHEIIHAFLNESGLSGECDWACNEEMVDYFAIQFHKIANVFKQLKC